MGNISKRTSGNLLCRSWDWPLTSLSYTRIYIYIIYNITRWEEGQLKLGFDVTLQIECPKQLSTCWFLFFLHVCYERKSTAQNIFYNTTMQTNITQNMNLYTYNKYFLKTIYNIMSCEHLDESKIYFLQRLKKFWLSSSVLNSLAPSYPFTFHLKIKICLQIIS